MMSFYRRTRNRRPLGAKTEHKNTIEAEGEAVLCFPPDCTIFRGLLTQNETDSYAIYGRECLTSPGQYTVTVVDMETGLQYQMNNVQLRGELRKPCETSMPPRSVPINISSRPVNDISMENSPNFDNIFINESCPNFTNNNFDMCASLSDMIITEDVESAVSKSPLESSQSSSRGSSMSPVSESKSMCPQFSLLCEQEGNQLQFTADKVYKGQKADMMIQKFMAGSKLTGSQCVVLSGPLKFCLHEVPFFNSRECAWSF